MLSPTEAAEQLRTDATRVRGELVRITRITAAHGAELAREMFGVRQLTWEPLADSTTKQKERLGFGGPPDYDPLLRTGEMRDSVQGRSSGTVGEVFSDDPKIIYSEFGTAREPPRPVLEPAVIEALFDADPLLRDLMDTIK